MGSVCVSVEFISIFKLDFAWLALQIIPFYLYQIYTVLESGFVYSIIWHLKCEIKMTAWIFMLLAYLHDIQLHVLCFLRSHCPSLCITCTLKKTLTWTNINRFKG
jgi:hypothetical protein